LAEPGARLPHKVHLLTGGAPPAPEVIGRAERLGFEISHGYGLTESYAGATFCGWPDQWNERPPEERARLKARPGGRCPLLEDMMVADPSTLAPVRKDGQTVGEVFLRGNTIMKGYYRNPAETEACFRHGWFRTGDLAVWHPDEAIEIKDRSKDIIISGGENI